MKDKRDRRMIDLFFQTFFFSLKPNNFGWDCISNAGLNKYQPLCFVFFPPHPKLIFVLKEVEWKSKKGGGDLPWLHAAIDVLRSAAAGRRRWWRCWWLGWRPVSFAKARHHLRVSLCTIFDFTRNCPCHWLRTEISEYIQMMVKVGFDILSFTKCSTRLSLVYRHHLLPLPVIYRNCWHGSFLCVKNLVASGPMSVRFLYGFSKPFGEKLHTVSDSIYVPLSKYGMDSSFSILFFLGHPYIPVKHTFKKIYILLIQRKHYWSK